MRAPRSLSEHRPIKRSLPEKMKQLRDLKEILKQLKPHTSASLRSSIERRIYDLSQELRSSNHEQEKPQKRTKTRIYAIYSD